MNEPIILANESLVLNGDFVLSFSDWIKAINGGWLGIAGEVYQGVQIVLLKAGNKSSVSQPLSVPKSPGDSACYVLSFLCEMRHTQAGTLVISIEGQAQKQVIELLPGAPRDSLDDQARLQRGQLLEFKPIEYEVELTLPFEEQDTLTVSVFSPANELGDYLSQVCITRIKIHLHLGPAVMQALKLDEQLLLANESLYLCLGASASASAFSSHRLAFVPRPDNIWLGTKAALVSADNPQGAIVATPGWGVDQPLDDQWTLDCPWIGDEEPYLFSMSLLNQYTADPYLLKVSLGHHRLVFRDVLEAAYYPVLEHGQSVRLGVQVASYYTGQNLDGRTVNWAVAGQRVKGAAVTDNQGWAYFDYQPTAAGDFTIEASVDSPYYVEGVVTEALAVRVLATNPWKDVSVIVDGNAARWEEKTGYPNRGTDYPVHLKLAADSPLLGTELSLHWSGDSDEQLGVVVSPALADPVPVTGVEPTWVLTSADQLDGRFELSLVCSKLLLPSPKKPMSLARNLVRIGEVLPANKFPVVDENESVLLRVQVVHVVVNGDGDPVLNALVDWAGPDGVFSTVTGVGGWASYLYTPTSAGDQIVTARIKAHAEAIAVEQLFDVKAIATSPWNNEVRILLDRAPVDRITLGVLCRRGQSHTLKVEPVTGSTWVGENISLHWRGEEPAIGLVPSDLETTRPLVATGVEWTLSSQLNSSISSLFDLELRLEGVPTPRELFGRLVSADLAQEMSLVLDQIPAALDGQTLFPCLGAIHRFNVLPNALSPLVGLDLSLEWSGTPADQLGATVKPAPNLTQPISDGGALWTLDFTASPQSGQFALTLELPQLNFKAIAKPMMLAHNKVRIEAVRESAVDPVIGQEAAWMWAQVYSHFTGRAVDQAAVTWTTPQGPSVVNTDAEGWSGFAFAPTIAETHQVEAVVVSPNDGYEDKRSMRVTALASDPWAGLTVRFDDEEEAQTWGEKTYFPRRKGEHTFELMAPENSPLFEQDLTLGMTGTGPAELGIRFLSEGLGVPRTFYDVGLRYTFIVGDLKDASFALRLSSERLASLSPANAMSLGEGSQVVKITANSRAYQVLDWGQEFVGQVTVVSAISGKPMVGRAVTWRSADIGVVTSVTDYYGVARVRFVPTTPGVSELTATVGDALHSDSITQTFTLNEPREIQELTSPDTTGYPGKEVSAVATVVSAITGDALEDVEVMWEYPGIKIAPTRTDEEGKARVEFKLPAIRAGVLEAIVQGGYGGWAVKLREFTVSPNADTWRQEFTLWLNGKQVDMAEGKLILVPEITHDLELRVNKYSWLIDWVSVALEDLSGAEALGLKFDPALKQPRLVDGAPLHWSISSADTGRYGEFSLKLTSPNLPDRPLPGQTLPLAEIMEVHFDKFPMKFGEETAYPCHGAKHTITLRPKPDSPLLGTSVKLAWSGDSAGDLGVVVQPELEKPQQLISEGVTWELDCRESVKNGDFSLQLTLLDWEEVLSPIPMSLGHNLVTAERWTVPGGGPFQFFKIRATSIFLKEPAPNVPVTVQAGGEPFERKTPPNGELSEMVSEDGFVSYSIRNRYDGSSA